jgi:hypothetical protein
MNLCETGGPATLHHFVEAFSDVDKVVDAANRARRQSRDGNNRQLATARGPLTAILFSSWPSWLVVVPPPQRAALQTDPMMAARSCLRIFP